MEALASLASAQQAEYQQAQQYPHEVQQPPMQQPPQYPSEVQPPPPNSTEYPAVHQTLVDSAVHQSLVVESSGGQQIEISNE